MTAPKVLHVAILDGRAVCGSETPLTGTVPYRLARITRAEVERAAEKLRNVTHDYAHLIKEESVDATHAVIKALGLEVEE